MVGWEKKTIKELADIYSGGTPRTNIPEYWDGDIIWVTPSDITQQDSKYITYSERNISRKGLNNSSAILMPMGTLLLCTRATIGEIAISARPATTNQGFKNLVCHDDVDNEFLYYALQITKTKMIGMAIGSTFLEISKTALENIELSIPSLPEQRAIAAALSDADSYIDALERLIVKKRNIKKGAMQKLLRPKDDWERVTVKTDFILKARIGWQGLTTAEYLDEGFAYLVTGTDFLNGSIDWKHCHYVDKLRYEQDSYIQINNNDVLITKDGTIGKVALVKNLNIPATLNSGVFVLRPKYNNCNNVFIYYILMSFVFRDFLDALTAGSTIIHLYQKDFENFKFRIPSLSEQTVIATILSDMDAEIDALTAQLTKAKLIKQGMMQELLTGRIRLATDEFSDTAKQESKVIPFPIAEEKSARASSNKKHNQQFDDAVMIAGIVNALYSDKYPLGRKKVQKCLYLLRRHQDESIKSFKKKAAGPYADEVRYKGGEPIAQSAKYIATTTTKGKGTTFACGSNIKQALEYIVKWGNQADIQWVTDKLKYRKVDDLELLATVDMAICDLEEAGIPVSVASIRNLIAANKEWKEKLSKPIFSDTNIARAISELPKLL